MMLLKNMKNNIDVNATENDNLDAEKTLMLKILMRIGKICLIQELWILLSLNSLIY